MSKNGPKSDYVKPEVAARPGADARVSEMLTGELRCR
jgi:hypothetical protein